MVYIHALSSITIYTIMFYAVTMKKVALALLALVLLAAVAQGNETIQIEFPDAGEDLNMSVLYDGFAVTPDGRIVTNSSTMIEVRCCEGLCTGSS